MRLDIRSRLLMTAGSVLALVTATPALAQSGPVPASPNGSAPSQVAATAPSAPDNTVGEVVVTAQKRSENLQKVPLAVTVVGGDLLKQNVITNASDLDQLVPSLTFKRGTANVNSTLSIRGIGTQSFSSGAEPSVSTVVDGVVFGRSGMAFQEFTDLDHIEVLEGPQGTLFGKNASAGAINIVTKAPSHTFGGDVSFGYYEGGDYRADANITGPINDRIRFALSGIYDDYRGNIYNAYQKAWTNGYHNLGLRGSIVADITDNLTFTVHADYVHGAENCCADVLGPYVPSAGLTNILLPSIAPVKSYFGSKEVYDNLSPRTEDGNGGVSGQLDYSLNGFTLTSITAWRNWRNKQVRDGDFHATTDNYVNSLDIDDQDYGALNYNQYSEELRITSPANRKLQYVGGAFFWYTDENDWFNRFVNRCYASTLPANATGSQPCSTAPGVSSFTSAALGNDDAPAHWNTKFYNQALFGQSTYALTDKLTLIGGVRVTHDRVQYDLGRTSFAPAGTPGIGSTFQYAEHAEAMGISGKAGAQYQLTPDNMLYATYSRGYKGPSLNDFYSENVGNVGKISPETSNAYEVGTKSQFLDHKLTFNGDFFWEDFSNFQANSFVNLNGVTVVTLKNAGSVRSYGAEFNTSWRATQDLTFVGGYTYDEATIVSYNCPSSIGAANVVTCLLHNGHTLPFAPKNKFNITSAYDVPIPQSIPFDVQVNSTYTYTSLINFDIDQTPLAKQPGYGLWDMAATITTKDGRYSLSFIGKNLTNQYYTDFITPSGNGIAAGSYTRLQVPRDAQRYVGVKATMNFH